MEMECKFNPTKNHDEREVSYDFRLRQLMLTHQIDYFFPKQAACKSRSRHNYYIWVPFVLFLQAFAFYIPVYLWKKWDSQDKIHRYIM